MNVGFDNWCIHGLYKMRVKFDISCMESTEQFRCIQDNDITPCTHTQYVCMHASMCVCVCLPTCMQKSQMRLQQHHFTASCTHICTYICEYMLIYGQAYMTLAPRVGLHGSVHMYVGMLCTYWSALLCLSKDIYLWFYGDYCSQWVVKLIAHCMYVCVCVYMLTVCMCVCMQMCTRE